jgi:hypothetical protein
MSTVGEMEELEDRLSPEELHEAWGLLAQADRMEGFRLLDRATAEDFFLALSSRDQAELLRGPGCASCRSTTLPT